MTRLLTAQEVAELLAVPPSFVYRLAREHRIPAVRLGERYIRFEAEAIERWIAAQSADDRNAA